MIYFSSYGYIIGLFLIIVAAFCFYKAWRVVENPIQEEPITERRTVRHLKMDDCCSVNDLSERPHTKE